MELNELKKQFGKEAQAYSKFRRPYPAELYEFLFSLLPAGEKTILDLACGPGNSTHPLLREDTKVSGCDIDPLMIEQAQKEAKEKNLDIEFKVGEAEHLPYADGMFDGVTTGAAFHWFVNREAIEEIKRVLKPGGLLFIYWTMNIGDVRKEDEPVLNVFRQFNWPEIPSEFRDVSYVSDFLKDGGFQNVSSKKLSMTYNESLEERVNLEKTNAGYGALSDQDKEKFLDSLQSALKSSLGEKESFVINEEVHIVYGSKP